MDRNIVYPSSIPLDTDLLSINRNMMIGLGFLAQAVLGAGPAVGVSQQYFATDGPPARERVADS